MTKKKAIDDVDLLDLILLLWNEKLKFFFIIFLFVFTTIIYQFTRPTQVTKLLSLTEVSHASSMDEVKYETYNFYVNKIKELDLSNLKKNSPGSETEANAMFAGIQINKEYLLELFIDQIKKTDFVSSVVKKSKLIKKENYNSNQAYENAISQLVYSIKLTRSNYNENTNEALNNWTIEFETQDTVAWTKFLKLLNKSANSEIQKFLNNSFKTYQNSKEKLVQYAIEDVEIEISNALDKHRKKMINRIFFLEEQAAIARKLEISKANLTTNTLESQTFSTESGIITNLKTETPYYMRGYEMIEKEIDLIKNRKNQDAFNDELIELESRRNLLLGNKDSERMQSLLEDTPIIKSNEFSAAKIMFETTKYQTKGASKINNIKIIILSGIIGAIIALFYITISNAIKKRNKISFRK